MTKPRTKPTKTRASPNPDPLQAKPSYLKVCLADFHEVSKAKYGTAFDLEAIERSLRTIGSKRTITYAELRAFEAREHWWFERYWILPPEDRVRPELENRAFNFWNPRDEGGLIASLLDIFKSIGLVSIILRFARPERYGIISPPVERVLDVRRGSDAVETYRNYLVDLRAIRAHYGFERTADADMALWVLHERCFGELREPEVERAYLSDSFMLQLRAKNLVSPLAEIPYSRLAAALRGPAPELAAVVASYTFELLIRELGKHLGTAEPGSRQKLQKVIDSLPSYAGVSASRRTTWRALKKLRDDLFHEGQQPTGRGLSQLVEEILAIEELLERIRADRPAHHA